MDDERARNEFKITRRGLLKMLALANAGAVLGGSVLLQRYASSAKAEGTGPAHQWGFLIDLRKCDGCAACTKACQEAHYLNKEQTWIKVYKMTSPTGQTYAMPRLCMQCENPPCVRICPVGATYRNPEGVILVDQNKCIGCRACMAACPYEARYFNWTDDRPPVPASLQQPMPEFPVPQRTGTVGKCILCVHNTQFGKLPICVEACTMEALYLADLNIDAATNGKETVKFSRYLKANDAVRYKEELGTRPRVWYILGHGQNLNF